MKFLQICVILACAVTLAACPTLFTGEGKVTIAARVQNSGSGASPSARTILPTIDPVSFRASFSGPEAVDPIELGSGGTGEIDLAFGTWTMTIEGLDAAGEAIARGTDTFTLSVVDPSHTSTVGVQALGTGTGRVDLTITWPAGLDPEVDSHVVTLDGAEVPAGTVTVDFASEPRSLRYVQDLAAGSYLINVALYAGAQIRNIYDEAAQIGGGLKSIRSVYRPESTFIEEPTPGRYVADHEVATDAVLRSIPTGYIDAARNDLHVAYFHTSHGTHVSYGLWGLPGFKSGDDTLFAVTGTTEADKLRLWDYAFIGTPADISTSAYIDAASPVNVDTLGFVTRTRTYLDNSANASVNVVMWSWCSIEGHNVQNYLDGMAALIAEYGPGGTKGRAVPVTFIFMTGHAELNANTGVKQPAPQAQLILDYCNANHYYCIDYYGIDTHDMDGTYYPTAGDDGNLPSGTEFYQAWQDSHQLGVDWYENRDAPSGAVVYGQHNTQHITANRKAFAMWYVLARIAGWSGN